MRLEIEHGEETISGRIAIEENPATDFYGWLELISAIECAVESGAPEQRDTT